MKDKTRTLLSAEIQVTPFNPVYDELDHMLFLSKNLYNACLYIERQLFFKKRDCKDPIQKSKLVSFISNFTLLNNFQDSNNPDYRALPSAVSQQVCKQVYLNYMSFFSLVKKDPKARMPKYLHKTKGRNRLYNGETHTSVMARYSDQYFFAISPTYFVTTKETLEKFPEAVDSVGCTQACMAKHENYLIKE